MGQAEGGDRDLTPGVEERAQLHGKVRRFGIVIGIDDYTNIPKLKGCVNDAEAMYSLMTDPKCGAFDPSQVTLLRDPTRKQIFDEFSKMGEKMKELENTTNEFWFYYAGHGSLYTALNNRSTGYILPKDTETNEKGGLQTYTAISAHDIHSVLIHDTLPCSKVVMFMDCCHAGALGRSDMRGVWDNESECSELQNALSQVGDGYICFQATAADRKARERKGQDGKMHGAYTLQLLNGLQGGEPGHAVKDDIANTRAIVTVSALNNYLSQKGQQTRSDGSINGSYPLTYSPTALKERGKENAEQKKIKLWLQKLSGLERDLSDLIDWLKRLNKGILKKYNSGEQFSLLESSVATLLKRYALTDLAEDQNAQDEFIQIVEALRGGQDRKEDQGTESANAELQKENVELREKIRELEDKISNTPLPKSPGRAKRAEELRLLAWLLFSINGDGSGKLPWDDVAYWGQISDLDVLKECCEFVGKHLIGRDERAVFPKWAIDGWRNYVNGGKCSEIEEIVYKQIVADIQAEEKRKSSKRGASR